MAVPDRKGQFVQRPASRPLLHALANSGTTRMTDGGKSYPGIGMTMASHQSVIHSNDEYANPETGAHVTMAEAVFCQIQRALVGVYHNLGRQHLQRYLNETYGDGTIGNPSKRS